MKRKSTHKGFKPRHEYAGFKRPTIEDLKRQPSHRGAGLKRSEKPLQRGTKALRAKPDRKRRDGEMPFLWGHHAKRKDH